MELKIEKTVMIDYIEISFTGNKKVEVSYISTGGEILKVQQAETLEQGLELIKGENK